MDGPVYAAIEPCIAFIKKNIALGATIGEIYRKDRWEYPLEAIREALVNAVIHRDYAILGSDVKVAIYDDMLEITSPGPLPDALSIEDLGSGRSEIRNRVLAPIFKDMKLIEAWGSGIRKIHDELKNYPEIKLVLQEAGQAFQVQFVKKVSIPQPESAPSRHQAGTKYKADENQIKILNKCKKPLFLVEMMKLVNRTDRTKFRKRVVLPLLENGLLEMTDPGSPNSPKQKYQTTV